MRKLLSLHDLFFVFSFIIFLAILSFFHFRGIVYYDEGYILTAALRVAHGQIPYRDFDMVYTPLSFVITGVFFKLFGASVFVSRIAAVLVSFGSLFALYKILNLLTKSIFVQFVALLFFIGWGPAHTNFVWPVMFAICFFLYALYFYLSGILHKNKQHFFVAGVMIVLVFLAKQNFGVGIFLAACVALFFVQLEQKKKYVLYFLFGAGASGLVYLIYLLCTASLLPFIENMYVYTFKRILVQKALDTPFLYQGSVVEKIVKFIFYTSPLLFSAVLFFVSKQTVRKLFVIPWLVAVFYLCGIRPTTDYNHLAPLLAVSGLSLVLGISSAKKKLIQNLCLIILIGFTVFGFYTAYFKGYYKWDYALSEQTTFFANPRAQLFINQTNRDEMQNLTRYIQSQTKPNESIFVNFYAPFIYFIADRANATRYDFYTSSELPLAYQLDAEKTLEQKKVKLVIMNGFNQAENSPVADYVRKHYPVRKNLGNWIVFSK